VMEQKPGRYWGVIVRQHLPLGKREDREVSASQAVKLRRAMRRYRVANTPPEKRKYLRKSQLWSEDFTAKLFCNVEFWLERLPKLIEFAPKFECPVRTERSRGSQIGLTICDASVLLMAYAEWNLVAVAAAFASKLNLL